MCSSDLALVKNLVTLHLGMISVESKLNEGTTFRLRLQKNEVYNSRIEPEDFEIEIPEQNNLSPVLLIVEDNDDIREYIADTFHSDFEVVTAVDGSEGLRFALQRVPDIIITDLMMPVMDGIEMCRKIKEDIRISHIPVIMLTAKDTEQNKEEGYLTGADSYMTKPFSSALLKARVENLLQKRKKMSDYYSANLRQTIMTDSIAQMENDFVKNVIEIIETNLESGEINISYLASQVNMGYSTFTRKIKALTGLTVNEMIRKIKMQNAEKLLLSGKYNVTEVMYRVGYNSLSSFREAFKNEFGVSPSGYIKKKV